MLGTSRLVLGLLREKTASVAAQVELWDRSNVIQAAWGQAAKRSSLARDTGAAFDTRVVTPTRAAMKAGLNAYLDPSGHASDRALDNKPHPLDFHIRKFCQLAGYARIKITEVPDVVTIHHWGLEIERDAVRCLRETDNRTLRERINGDERKGFEGNSLDDLVRYVVQQTFQNLDAEFRKKSAAEQAVIADRIASALRDLPPEEQERIRNAARLPDLTSETLKQTGALAILGVGFSSSCRSRRIFCLHDRRICGRGYYGIAWHLPPIRSLYRPYIAHGRLG